MKKEDLKKEFEAGGVVITKDNIHLYYEFMSDDDLEKYSFVLDCILDERNRKVLKILNVKLNDFHKYGTYLVKNEHFINMKLFGIKDTLKPIDEYIEEIKASEEYKEYIKSKGV